MAKLTVFMTELLKQRQACDNPHVRAFLDASPMAPVPRSLQLSPATAVGVRTDDHPPKEEGDELILHAPSQPDSTQQEASQSPPPLKPGTKSEQWSPPLTPTKGNTTNSSSTSSPKVVMNGHQDSPSRSVPPTDRANGHPPHGQQEEKETLSPEGPLDAYSRAHIQSDHYDAAKTNTFPVRGLTYMEDGIKIPSGHAIGKLLYAVSGWIA